MSGPDWASITTAIGTGVLGLTGLIGVIAANNRVRRGTGEIEADAFDGPARATAVRVRVTVRSTGLGRLQLAEDANSPSITVTEVNINDEGQQSPGTSWVKQVLAAEIVDPGETTSATFVFLVSQATPRTLGWEVAFQFAVRQRWPHHEEVWYWTDTTFVAVPSRGRSIRAKRYHAGRR